MGLTQMSPSIMHDERGFGRYFIMILPVYFFICDCRWNFALEISPPGVLARKSGTCSPLLRSTILLLTSFALTNYTLGKRDGDTSLCEITKNKLHVDR